MKLGANANGIIIFAKFKESMNCLYFYTFWIDIIEPWINPKVFPYLRGYSAGTFYIYIYTHIGHKY